MSKLLRGVALFDEHPDGVLEMLLFNRLGGRQFSKSATLPSKIDEMSKLLRRVALFNGHLDGVLEMLLFNRLCGRMGSSKCYFSIASQPRQPAKAASQPVLLACSRRIQYSVTRWRPASPALAQTQPSPCSRLRLCCLVVLAASRDLIFAERSYPTWTLGTC